MYYFSVTVFEGIMINAQELRFGNLVNIISHIDKSIIDIGTVNLISDISLHEEGAVGACASSNIAVGSTHELSEEDKNTLSPIPLTEEWLIKFGFASNEYKDEFYKSYIHLDCEYTDHNTFNVAFKGLKLSIDVKYVHQLQNLFFALCGEELNIIS